MSRKVDYISITITGYIGNLQRTQLVVGIYQSISEPMGILVSPKLKTGCWACTDQNLSDPLIRCALLD